MNWVEVRKCYPDQWVVVEAVEAYTTPDQRRHLSKISVLEQCSDGTTAFKIYEDIHKKFPSREFYYLHTKREYIEIIEEVRLGPRI